MRTSLIAGLVAVTAACGGGSQTPDAPMDGAVDAADAGPCTGRELTLEYVDWDSSTTAFLGIGNARFTVEGLTGRSATTAPNGRLVLCTPTGAPVRATADSPATYVDAVVFLDEGAITQTVRPISFRSFTAARAASFYTERGISFDATRGHILIFQTGDKTALSLNRPYDKLIGGEDTGTGAVTWGMDGGRYELFANVSADEPVARIGGPVNGPREVPVAAGKLTLVALHSTVL